jgi:hypothetical protein
MEVVAPGFRPPPEPLSRRRIYLGLVLLVLGFAGILLAVSGVAPLVFSFAGTSLLFGSFWALAAYGFNSGPAQNREDDIRKL